MEAETEKATQPKETTTITESGPEATLNPNVFDFQENDPTNPRNWSKPRKWTIVILVACLSANNQLCTIIAAPVSPPILATFHSTNTLYRTLIVSIWELGEIISPLVWGPLSELYGRRWILNIANLLFVAFLAGTALSTSIQMLIAFRFLSGAATAISPIGPGIVEDLFAEEHRGRAMSMMSMMGAFGPIVGPIVGSYLGEKAGWRWAFWLPTILAGALGVLLFALYRETYKVTILERKVREQRLATGNRSLRSKYETDETARQKFFNTGVRPLKFLVWSPILALSTIYLSVVYGYTYLTMTIIAPVFQDIYGFSEGASGLAFLGLCLGFVIGAFLCSFLSDRYVRIAKARSQVFTPEQRLPPLLIACVIMSAGLFLFGWSVQYRLQYVVTILGTGIIGLGLVATSICVQTYIVDAFGIYSVSAISAMMVVRNTTAAFLPLAGPPLFSSLGYHWGGTLLGCVVLFFSPMPLVLMRMGGKLRARDTRFNAELVL
ncbi:MFS general substrate transporter [Aspergillus ellipticus CBS 707.79]|uniref:MFS general substrate transporter n=1 Tax=Aspergillus ellipticus CBS 707.79 TaxID=1448320 RepID=A0A319DM76_9EURO|nr:MFS general substrate transporter [Aspergillus ellipticus CBS 707.79]